MLKKHADEIKFDKWREQEGSASSLLIGGQKRSRRAHKKRKECA